MKQDTKVGWRGNGFRSKKSISVLLSTMLPMWNPANLSARFYQVVLLHFCDLFCCQLRASSTVKQMVNWLNHHHLAQEQFRTGFPATNSAQKIICTCSSTWKLRLLVNTERRKIWRPLHAMRMGYTFPGKKTPSINSIHQQKQPSGGTILSPDKPKTQLDLLLLFNITAGTYWG